MWMWIALAFFIDIIIAWLISQDTLICFELLVCFISWFWQLISFSV